MNEFFAHPGWQRLLLALLHSSWLIAVTGGVLWCVLPMLRQPRTRYAVGLGGLAVFALVPVLALLVVETPTDTLASAGSERAVDSVGGVTAEVRGDAFVHDSGGATTGEPDSRVAVETTWLDRLRPWLLVGWLSGVGLFSIRLTLGLFGVAVMQRGREPLPERLVGRVRRLRRRLEVPASVVVAGSRRVAEAVAVGFFRPVVLIPTAWLTSMPTAVLEAIVAHELAHVRRWDLWVNLFQRVLETLLFFHPVVWWLSGRVRVDRELCCDRLAAKATGKQVVYARALEYVANRRVEAATPLVAAGWGGTRMRLLERVKNVLGVPGEAGGTGWWPLAVVAVVLGTGVWFAGPAISAAAADDEERTERRDGDGDRERGEREERRDGDRERGEREERRFDGDRERFERDGDRERDGERERRFDGDREREGDRPRFREVDRPRGEGERDRPPFREGERRFREGDRPPEWGGDRPHFDLERERPPFRDGDRPRQPFGDRAPRPDGEVGELIDIIRDLRREVEQLRREVHEIRGRRPDVERERPRFGEDELRERLRRELEEVERRGRGELERRERELEERRRDVEREFDRDRERFERNREEFEERRRFERERDEEERERFRRDRDEEEEEDERFERDDDEDREREEDEDRGREEDDERGEDDDESDEGDGEDERDDEDED